MDRAEREGLSPSTPSRQPHGEGASEATGEEPPSAAEPTTATAPAPAHDDNDDEQAMPALSSQLEDSVPAGAESRAPAADTEVAAASRYLYPLDARVLCLVRNGF